MPRKPNPLSGISPDEQATMRALLRKGPERQKDASKPMTKRGEGQRRRREREHAPSHPREIGSR